MVIDDIEKFEDKNARVISQEHKVEIGSLPQKDVLQLIKSIINSHECQNFKIVIINHEPSLEDDCVYLSWEWVEEEQILGCGC